MPGGGERQPELSSRDSDLDSGQHRAPDKQPGGRDPGSISHRNRAASHTDAKIVDPGTLLDAQSRHTSPAAQVHLGEHSYPVGQLSLHLWQWLSF